MRTLNLSREAQGTCQLSLPYQEEFIKTPLMFPNYINWVNWPNCYEGEDRNVDPVRKKFVKEE